MEAWGICRRRRHTSHLERFWEEVIHAGNATSLFALTTDVRSERYDRYPSLDCAIVLEFADLASSGEAIQNCGYSQSQSNLLERYEYIPGIWAGV